MAGLSVSDTNICMIEGEVIAEPDVREFESGAKKTRLRVAAKRRWKDKTSGEFRESSSFLDVTGWRDVGERMSSLHPGDAVTVIGELRSWMSENKETGQKKYGVEVEASSVSRAIPNPVDEQISFPSQQEAASLPSTSGW